MKLLAVALAGLTVACTASAPPSASPSVPSSASATGTAGPTPTTGASPGATATSGVLTLADRYGWIVSGPNATGTASDLWIRPETDPQKRTPVTGAMLSASPDGTQVASWRPSPGGELTDLVLFPAPNPDQARSVFTLAGGRRGIEIVWASDGTGLLVRHQGVNAPGESLVSIDLRASNSAVTLGTMTDGRTYVPIAWDRATNLIAAAETTVYGGGAAAPDLQNYLVIKPGPTPSIDRTPIGDRIPSPTVKGSPDGRWAYGRGADGVRVWPTNNYAAGHTFQPAGLTGSLAWRPGTTHLVWVDTADKQLHTYDAATKAAAVVMRGLAPDPTSGGPSVGAVRFDGSAALVGRVQGGTRWILVDLSTGAQVPFDMGTAFGPGVSVRLR